LLCIDRRSRVTNSVPMVDHSSFLKLPMTCDESVKWLIERLTHAGLTIRCTFDLQIARHAQNECSCPYHGTDQCDCQMVVLLVYSGMGEPVTLVAHGNNDHTWFSVVDTPQQRADPQIESTIRHFISIPLQSLP